MRCVLAALVFTGLIISPTSAFASAPIPNPGPPVTGSIGLRLVDAPVAAGNDPRALIYIVDHLAPRTVIRRRVEVSNGTTSVAHVALYAAAATISQGSFLGAEGRTQNDLSSWTSVSPGQPDVAAGGSVTANVTISVPGDAAPGEQYAVVWAEVRSAPVAGGGVTQVSRVGIRLYVSVGGGGSPAANFTIDSLTAARSPDQLPVVIATVHNTGGRALDMSGTLQLTGGPAGLSAGPFAATLGVTLAIGDTAPVTIVLDDRLPAGPWIATITLHSGLVERSASASITFPDAGVSAPVEATGSTEPGWPYVAIAASVFFLLLLLLGTAALLIRRRRHRRRPNCWAPPIGFCAPQG